MQTPREVYSPISEPEDVWPLTEVLAAAPADAVERFVDALEKLRLPDSEEPPLSDESLA